MRIAKGTRLQLHFSTPAAPDLVRQYVGTVNQVSYCKRHSDGKHLRIITYWYTDFQGIARIGTLYLVQGEGLNQQHKFGMVIDKVIE